MNISKISAGSTISECHKILDKIGKITPKSVERTSEKNRCYLREHSPARLKELAQMNCYAAEKIKTELDKQYGEGNYVVISLGRSISSICELMRYLGTEVMHLPLSGLRRNDFAQINDNGIVMFKKYVKSIGLTKKELKKNKDKKYILMDYTYYGRSLEKTYEFLKQPDMLSNTKNFIKLPVCEILGEDYTQKAFQKLFEYLRFKNYAMVGKLPVNNLSDIFIQANERKAVEYQGNITKGMRKLFWFNVFDSLKSCEYKEKIFPQKECDALYKHYLSPKAVQNYLKREITKINTQIEKTQ